MNQFKWKKKHTVWLALGITYLVIALFIAIVVHNDALHGVLEKALDVFAPVIIGLVLAYLSNPLYNFIHKNIFTWKNKLQSVRKLLTMILTYIVILLFLAVFLMMIIPQLSNSINELVSKIWIYLDTSLGYLNRLLDSIPFFEDIPDFTVESIQEAIKELFPSSGGEGAEATGNSFLNFIATISQSFGGQIQEFASNIVSGVIGIVANTVVALFIAGYILAGKQRLGAQIRKIVTALFHEKGCQSFCNFFSEINSTFGRYFKGACLDSLMVGIVSFILFSVTGIPYALLVAFIVGVTNIIPFFGPFLGAIPSAVIIFIASPPKVITFVILILVIQQIDGNIIAPRIHSNSTGLSSLGVIIAITVMGGYFGILGMFVGVPLVSVICNLIKRLLENKLIADGEPTELESYFPPKTKEIDLHVQEHTPVLTRLFCFVNHKLHPAQEEVTIVKTGKQNRKANDTKSAEKTERTDIAPEETSTPDNPEKAEESTRQNEK